MAQLKFSDQLIDGMLNFGSGMKLRDTAQSLGRGIGNISERKELADYTENLKNSMHSGGMLNPGHLTTMAGMNTALSRPDVADSLMRQATTLQANQNTVKGAADRATATAAAARNKISSERSDWQTSIPSLLKPYQGLYDPEVIAQAGAAMRVSAINGDRPTGAKLQASLDSFANRSNDVAVRLVEDRVRSIVAQNPVMVWTPEAIADLGLPPEALEDAQNFTNAYAESVKNAEAVAASRNNLTALINTVSGGDEVKKAYAQQYVNGLPANSVVDPTKVASYVKTADDASNSFDEKRADELTYEVLNLMERNVDVAKAVVDVASRQRTPLTDRQANLLREKAVDEFKRREEEARINNTGKVGPSNLKRVRTAAKSGDEVAVRLVERFDNMSAGTSSSISERAGIAKQVSAHANTLLNEDRKLTVGENAAKTQAAKMLQLVADRGTAFWGTDLADVIEEEGEDYQRLKTGLISKILAGQRAAVR